MKREVREKARDMRRAGFSLSEIATQLFVSKGSVSSWVRDIHLSDEQAARLKAKQKNWGGKNSGARQNQDQAREQRRAYQEAGREHARAGSVLHLTGCMLYWAEGAKSRNGIYFANSDPQMMLLFMRFLREELYVVDGQIKLLIHCHTNNPDEIQRIERFWLEILELPRSSLSKTSYKQGSATRKNILANGVCSIRVYSTELTHHIYGAIQEYGGFDRPEWLF